MAYPTVIMRSAKGQFNIEYLVALVIFISILIFLSLQLAQAVPEFHTESVSNRLRAQAFRVTDGLMKTPGEPERWEFSSAAAYGFAERPYGLNATKLAAFQDDCTDDYAAVKETLGLDVRSDFQMMAIVNGTVVIDCGQQRVPLEAVQVLVRRTGYVNGTLAELTLLVWT